MVFVVDSGDHFEVTLEGHDFAFEVAHVDVVIPIRTPLSDRDGRSTVVSEDGVWMILDTPSCTCTCQGDFDFNFFFEWDVEFQAIVVIGEWGGCLEGLTLEGGFRDALRDFWDRGSDVVEERFHKIPF